MLGHDARGIEVLSLVVFCSEFVCVLQYCVKWSG